MFCLIGAPVLIYQASLRGEHPLIWSVSLFCVGLLFVYAASSSYHAANNPELKRKLNIVDHISIYFLIAGTYSPVIIKYLPAESAGFYLTIMWSFVAVGTIFKLFFTGKFEFVSLALYVGMGWMLIFMIQEMLKTLPMEILYWILMGGIFYSSGIYFYVKSHKRFHHAIWHIFVMLGSFAHYVSIYKMLN